MKVYGVWLLPVTALFWEFYTRQFPDSSSVTKIPSMLLGQETGREVLAGRDGHTLVQTFSFDREFNDGKTDPES